jgi:hypothetical protein
MTDTARDILDVDTSSTEGLDDLFTLAQPLRNGEPLNTQPFQSENATLASGLSFKEACDFYHLKPTALRSRIKTGKVSAVKVDGPNGPEWRIYPEALVTPSRNPGDITAEPSRGPGDTVAQVFRDPIDSRLFDMIDDLQLKLEQANRQLQAANFRVGYLENQVSERHNDIIDLTSKIKLLTDSQHKTTWWQLFKAFFVKQ